MVWELHDDWLVCFHNIGLPLPTEKKTSGKWVIFEDFSFIYKQLDKINEYVQSRLLHQAKFPHKIFKEIDPFPNNKPPLLVYADKKTKELVKSILIKDFKWNSSKMYWKTDEQSIKDWETGGKLFNASEKQK